MERKIDKGVGEDSEKVNVFGRETEKAREYQFRKEGKAGKQRCVMYKQMYQK
jgi:hypothetical protein